MLVEFLEVIFIRLKSVWRIFGSPRIAGDEKAAAAVKSAWTDKGRARNVGSDLPPRTRYAILGATGVLIAAVLIWLVLGSFGGGDDDSDVSSALATPTPFAGPEFMNEVRSLSIALSAARDSGLVSQNFEHVARRITFGEYATAIGEADRAERGLLETPSDTEVWAVAFAGDVQLELDTGDRVKYDNLTVVLDALTGKVYRVEAFFGEYESEARAPVWLRPATPTPVPTPTRVPLGNR
ncbi:MAG: hypothetical protein V3T49_06225 [Dehalococcoidia bacterium]